MLFCRYLASNPNPRANYCLISVGLGIDIIRKEFKRELRDGKLELNDLNIYKLAPCDSRVYALSICSGYFISDSSTTALRNHELTNNTPNLLEAKDVCLGRRYLRGQLVDAVREYLNLRNDKRIFFVKMKEDEMVKNNEVCQLLNLHP